MKVSDITGNLVASPPVVYFQLKQALENPDTTFKEYAGIISRDPALSVRLLKIANSAFYGLQSEVKTINHALTILGVDQMSDLALTTVVIDKFKGIPPDLVNMNDFWRHSIACGIVAQSFAKLWDKSGLHRSYISGMLHDIGSLVIYTEIPDKAREVLLNCRETGRQLCLVEREFLGFDHADVGSVLLKEWKLPNTFVEAAAYHHKPLSARNFPLDAAIIHVADSLAQKSIGGNIGEPNSPEIEPEVCDKFELEENLVKRLTLDVKEKLDEVMLMFY